MYNIGNTNTLFKGAYSFLIYINNSTDKVMFLVVIYTLVIITLLIVLT